MKINRRLAITVVAARVDNAPQGPGRCHFCMRSINRALA